MKCILDLDDYSLFKIISYIKNIREKIRLKRVCKRFNDISKEALKFQHKSIIRRSDVYYKNEMRLATEKRVHFPFDKLLNNCPNLIEFNSSAFDRICWNWKKLPPFIGLEKLTIRGWSNVKMSKMIIEKCKNLKSLEIGCNKTSKNALTYKTNFKIIQSSLTSLKLHGAHYTIQNIQEFLKAKGQSLKIFKYSSCFSHYGPEEPYFFVHLIQIIFSNCYNLQKMELKFIQHNRFGPLETLSPLFKLENLIIKTDQKDFNIFLLETIITNCPNLQKIKIVSNYIDSNLIIEVVKKYCPAIKCIQIQPLSWQNLFDLQEIQE